MMAATGYSPRQRLLVLWLARLALIVYVFQIGAIDHWHARPDAVSGIVGSQLHAAHCHSASASCADSSSLAGSLTDVALSPVLPPVQAHKVVDALDRPSEAIIESPDQPPRTAA